MIKLSTLNDILSTLKEIGALPSILFIGGALYTGVLTLIFLFNVTLYIVEFIQKGKF